MRNSTICNENYAGCARRGSWLTLVLCLFVPFGVSAYEKNINCGGPAYTAIDGTEYLADQAYTFDNCAGYVDGIAAATPAAITGTSDPELYKTERFAVSQYKFDVPNGFYEVTLRFSEMYFGYSGGRVFSVWIEGQRMLTDLDIYQQVGMNHALDYTFVVEVKDGQLTIQAQATMDWPKFSAISVKSLITPQPQELTLKGFDVAVSTNWRIAVNMSDPNDLFAAIQLQDHLATNCGLFLNLVDTSAMPGDYCILLANPHRDASVRAICSERNMLPESRLGEEGYLLEVFTNNLIIISANFPQGVFYGMQTLRQLLRGQKGVAYVRPVVYGHSGSTSNGNAMFDNFSLVDESVGGSSNMLLNPGFEDGFASYSYGGCVGISGAAAESGTNGVMFYDGGDIDGGFWQDCPAVGGKKYRTSIRAREQAGFDPAYLVLVLEFYDASYVQVKKTQTDIGSSLTTNWQTFTHWDIAPACTATVRAVRIRDWPDNRIRGVHFCGANYFGSSGTVIRGQIDELARLKLNTAILENWSNHSLDEFSTRTNIQAIFSYCRQRHIEPIPDIGSSGPVISSDPCTAEGVWIQDEHFRFVDNTNVSVIPVDMPLENPDFEMGDTIPDGWTLGTYWIWSTDACSGLHSLMVSIPGTTSAITGWAASGMMGATSNTWYGLRFYAKAMNTGGENPPTIRVRELDENMNQLTNANGAWIQHNYELSQPSWDFWRQGWHKAIMNFMTCSRCRYVQIYANVYGGYGTAWFDDLRLIRINSAMANVLRTSETDIDVKDLSGTHTYVEDVDYEVIDGELAYQKDGDDFCYYNIENTPTKIVRLPSGAIASNEEVLVTYDSAIHVWAWAVWSLPYCISEPRVYEGSGDGQWKGMYQVIDEVIDYLDPKYIFFSVGSEVRGINRDSRDRRRGLTNAELMADDINKLHNHVRHKNPAVRMMIWNDMLNPWHNGSDTNYQVNFGGIPGETGPAVDLISKDMILGIWWYSRNDDYEDKPMLLGPDYFCDKGFGWFGVAWKDTAYIDKWAELIRGHSECLGLIGTTWYPDGWSGSVDGIRYVGERSWRSLPGRRAVASSYEHLDLQAANAIDGDAGTRWSSQHTDDEWIYVDLGVPRIFDTVNLTWETAYAKRYEILLSDDAANWTTVCTVTNGAGGVDTLCLGEQTARYVMMNGLESGTGHGYSLREFEVYAADADEDGLPDYWERRYFADLTNMTASSDVDGDGFLDWNEYVAGTDPTDASSLLAMISGYEGVDSFVVQWPSASNKYYTLYRSTSLMEGFVLMAPNVRAIPPVNFYTDAVSGVGHAYYRIKVEE